MYDNPASAHSDRLRAMKAVERLSNPAMLAAIAKEACKAGAIPVCEASLRNPNLVDQAVLMELVETGNGNAIGRLTDQAMLAKVAFEDPDERIRDAATARLDEKLYPDKNCWDCRFIRIGTLEDSDPRLKRIAGGLDEPDVLATNSFARMKLATREPLIQARLPGLKCVGHIEKSEQGYRSWQGEPTTVYGEIVTFKLQQKGATLAERTWKTEFGQSITRKLQGTEQGTQHARVHGQDLLSALFRLPAFSQNDLKNLAHSSIPEVRDGAVVPALGCLDAYHSSIPELRIGAVVPVLGCLDASYSSIPEVRIGAVADIADPAFLATVLRADKSVWVRRAAVMKVTDPAALREAVEKDPDQPVRLHASERLRVSEPK